MVEDMVEEEEAISQIIEEEWSVKGVDEQTIELQIVAVVTIVQNLGIVNRSVTPKEGIKPTVEDKADQVDIPVEEEIGVQDKDKIIPIQVKPKIKVRIKIKVNIEGARDMWEAKEIGEDHGDQGMSTGRQTKEGLRRASDMSWQEI